MFVLSMWVLGIESSCDECAAAIVADGRVFSNVVASQVSIHSPYGGVVPELASRDHAQRIIPVIEKALDKAGLKISCVDGIGVTAGPGLIGSLLIGVSVAKTLAWSLSKPIVGVNHLEAHLHAVRLEKKDLCYPYLGLVVSGGHTSLFRVEGVGCLNLVGHTLDDAAGEAFDKVAKLLHLGYPGGVAIEQAARDGNPRAICFPRPMSGRNLNFSFSGLKTSAAVWLKKHGLPKGESLCNFSASFQQAVVDTLVRKTMLAAREYTLRSIVVAGGVAANLCLRKHLAKAAEEQGVEVITPSLALCTDNAAMVAILAEAYLAQGCSHGMDMDADANLGW